MAASILISPSAAVGAIPFATTPDGTGNQVGAHALWIVVNGIAVPVGPGNPVPVIGASAPLNDASGPVGTGSTIMLIGGARQFLEIQNTGVADVRVNFGAQAAFVPGSYHLSAGANGAGGSLRFTGPGYVPSDAVYAIAAAAGGGLTIKWG